MQQAFGTGYLVPFALPVGYQSGDRRVLDPELGPSGNGSHHQPREASRIGIATPIMNLWSSALRT